MRARARMWCRGCRRGHLGPCARARMWREAGSQLPNRLPERCSHVLASRGPMAAGGGRACARKASSVLATVWPCDRLRDGGSTRQRAGSLWKGLPTIGAAEGSCHGGLLPRRALATRGSCNEGGRCSLRRGQGAHAELGPRRVDYLAAVNGLEAHGRAHFAVGGGDALHCKGLLFLAGQSNAQG